MDLEPTDDGADPDAYRFTTRLNDRRFTIDVSRRAATSPDDAERVADEALSWVGAHVIDLRLQCAEDLLEDYNTEWAEGDERRSDADEPLSAGDFGSRLVLSALAVAGDGSLHVTYLDDGMFGGHDVVVETDADRTELEAFLEG